MSGRSQPHFVAGDARALFELLAGFGGIHLCAIHPNGLSVKGGHLRDDVDRALAWAEQMNLDGFGVYWTVNTVRLAIQSPKPSKADITSARFVHVDIDPPKTGGKFDKEAITTALADLSAPPSFIVDSGGGLNAFWRLEGPCKNLASIESINLQVRDYFGADACQNIDRVMRVPGTINYPNARKRARGRGESQATWAMQDDGTVYDPAELAASFPAPTSPPSAVQAVTIPADIRPQTPDTLGLPKLDPIRSAISDPPGQDRSGDGLAAARLMANSGLTDEQIVGVLLNSDNAVSAHYLDQRDPKRAAIRTLQVVRADGPVSGEALHPDEPAMTAEQHAALVKNMLARAKKGLAEPAPAPRPTQGEPRWLRDLGDDGLARFVRHVLATAPSPQPWVTLGAALSMFGAVAGRRYAGPTNLRTNIYSIGICDSGGGKDHPLRAITRLMIDAGLARQVGGSKIASGSGLVTAVTRNPAILFPLDEVGFLISSAADRRRAPKHITEIIDNLTEFYSLADSTFLGTAYANDKEKPREVIEQPCLCLFGVTTPGVFWGSLSSGNVLDGSLARMLIFQSENDYPDAQEIVQHPMPEELVELVKAISNGAEGHNAFPIGDSPQIVPKPYVVPYADAAAAILAKAMREEQISKLREAAGSNLTGIIARLAENAAKIALVKAITDNPTAPRLTTADLEWGMLVARESVAALTRAVKERVADTAYEGDLKFIHHCIIEGGSAGLSSSDLSKVAKKIPARQRRDILTHLVEAGDIRIEEVAQAEGKPGPKPFICYDIS